MWLAGGTIAELATISRNSSPVAKNQEHSRMSFEKRNVLKSHGAREVASRFLQTLVYEKREGTALGDELMEGTSDVV